jgi:predicted nucleic acid-binding protein
VRFWDTSALVPLLILERGTPIVARWLRQDPVVIVWTLTRVELISALARHRREAPRDAAVLIAAQHDLQEAWERWSEVTAVDVVRGQAERIVQTHPLKAADALQIAAALVAVQQNPALHEFVTLDEPQATTAEREGLRVLTWP